MISQKFFAEQFAVGALSAVKISNVELFDVVKIFDCGQCFRFDPVSDTEHEAEFAGCAHGKYISVAQSADAVYIYNATLDEYESLWKSFLGLDKDYGRINADILSRSEIPALCDAVDKSSGIRILKQDEWEAMCSFIISQNNNIPRIKKLISSLSLACGERVDLSLMEGHIAASHKEAEGNFYSFPAPDALIRLGVSGLAELKTGFRAKYIYDAAVKISDGDVDFRSIHEMTTSNAKDELCRIKGIGPKVASCALLFGFEKSDAFPIDVWIKKVMTKYFDAHFDPESLGPYAGIAQQYLFYYERYLQSKGA